MQTGTLAAALSEFFGFTKATQLSLFDDDNCGANADGGGGFQRGNVCGGKAKKEPKAEAKEETKAVPIDAGPAGLTKAEAVKQAQKGKGETLKHSEAVAATMLYLGSNKSEWEAVGVTGMVEASTDNGRQKMMPQFSFPDGYKHADTPWAADDCCHLCGTTIKNVFWIQNDKKALLMAVGSECVTNFGPGESGEKNVKKQMSQIRRDLVKESHDLIQKFAEKVKQQKNGRNITLQDVAREIGNEDVRKRFWRTAKSLGLDPYNTQWTVKNGVVAEDDFQPLDGITKHPKSSDQKIANWHKKNAADAEQMIADLKRFTGYESSGPTVTKSLSEFFGFTKAAEPKDGDGDGMVFDGTEQERPVDESAKKASSITDDVRERIRQKVMTVDVATMQTHIERLRASGADEMADEYERQLAEKVGPTKSATFKQWFGDWESNPEAASKVVDVDGNPQDQTHIREPKPVFHGTGKGGWNQFEPRWGQATGLNGGGETLLFGPGFYFTEDPTVAESYSKIGVTDRYSTDATKGELSGVLDATMQAYQKDLQSWIDADMEADATHVKSSMKHMSELKQKLNALDDHQDNQDFLRAVHAYAQIQNAEDLSFMLPDNIRKKVAKTATSEVKKVYLNIKRPLDMDAEVDSSIVEKLKPILTSETEKDLRDRFATGKVYGYELPAIVGSKVKLNEQLQVAGYDGLTHIGGRIMGGGKEHRVWIAFAPTQIKSVNNEGTFDPQNPDIRKSLMEFFGFTKEVKDGDGDGLVLDGTEQERPVDDKQSSERSDDFDNPYANVRWKVLDWAENNFRGVEKAKEFTRWFGDSKIVAANGTPLTVYHGTNAKIIEFDPAAYIESRSTREYGIYVTPRKRYAGGYGGNVIPMFVSMKNPKIVTDKSEISPRDLTHDDVKKLQSQGYDGIVSTSMDGKLGEIWDADEIVVFSSNQLKHATENTGTFDPQNPDIRKSLETFFGFTKEVKDGDGDGLIHDGTANEQPAPEKKPKPKKKRVPNVKDTTETPSDLSDHDFYIRASAKAEKHLNARRLVALDEIDAYREQVDGMTSKVKSLQTEIAALEKEYDGITDVKKRFPLVEKANRMKLQLSYAANEEIRARAILNEKFRTALNLKSATKDPKHNSKSLSVDVKSAVRDGVHHVKQWTSDEILANVDVGIAPIVTMRNGEVVENRNSRSFVTAKGKIMALSPTVTEGVVAHEFGHCIEYANPHLQKLAKGFLAKRVNGEEPVSLKQKFGGGYDDSEFGRKDNFETVFDESSAYYVGKYYKDATEVISMGIEQLHRDPVRFAENDPEYFNLMVGALQGVLK